MQPAILSRAAVGPTPWIPVNSRAKDFKVGLGVELSQGATITYTVQHCFANFQEDQWRYVSLSQTLTTITVTDSGADGNGHGLVAGDWVRFRGSGDATNTDGIDFTIATTPSDTTYTITSTTSQSLTGLPGTKVLSARVFPHASLAAQTARGNGSYDFPVRAVRLNITAYTGGRAYLEVTQGQ